MTDPLFLVYLTFDSVDQAKKVAKQLMQKKLCACVNIFPEMQSVFFWPPKSGKVDESQEVAVLVKTLESKYDQLEEAIYEIHPHETPCIIVLKADRVGEKYYEWIVGELE